MSTIPLPPPWLDGEDFERLNQWFYEVAPHAYFDARLGMLMAHAERPDALRELIRQGFEYRGLKVGRRDTADEVEDDVPDYAGATDEKLHSDFVLTESVGLLHYLSETLLRFYLVHAREPECPWLEIAKQLDHRGFKSDVRKRFEGQPLTDERRVEIAWTVFGHKESPADIEPDKWNASIENAELWLGHFASWLLDDSNLFNSTKHGLTVHPGESSFELRTPADPEDGSPLIHADGPSMLFLERIGVPVRWNITSRWVEPQRLMAEASIALRMLRSVWQLGRIRYTGRKERESIVLFFRPDFKEYMDSYIDPGEPGKVVFKRLSMPLSYRFAYEPDLQCVVCERKPNDGENAHETWRGRRVADNMILETLCPECARELRE